MQGGRSGVGQYILALTQAFMPYAAQHEFTLFVLERDLPLFSFAVGRMWLEPVSERFRPPLHNIAWHQTVLPVLLRHGRYDVLHVPTYRRMLWPRPCALVATIHDLAPFRLPGKYDWARSFYGRVAARRLAWRQDRIIAVSRHTAGDLRLFFELGGQRVTVVPNGIDHERFQPGPAESSRRELCAPRRIDRPFFLYVSRLEHPGKNHVRLIEAFERFRAAGGPPWLLVFAGADWHGAPAIHARIRASPWAGDIRSLGFVAPRELPAWYRAAGALVYPSLYEGFGLPPVEAMACGCPVLSSRRGALAEVTAGAAAVLEPEDPAQMGGALARIAADPAERGRLQAAGLRRARVFDWSRTAQSTLEVYGHALQARRRVKAPGPLGRGSGTDSGADLLAEGTRIG